MIILCSTFGYCNISYQRSHEIQVLYLKEDSKQIQIKSII